MKHLKALKLAVVAGLLLVLAFAAVPGAGAQQGITWTTGIQVQNLSTTDPVAFTSAIRPIIQQFQSDVQGFGQTLQKPDDPQLTAAFSQAPECAKLVSATPSASPTS